MCKLGRVWILTLAKARCCWAWQLAWASSLATTFLRRASASSAAWIRSLSPICNTSVTLFAFSWCVQKIAATVIWLVALNSAALPMATVFLS